MSSQFLDRYAKRVALIVGLGVLSMHSAFSAPKVSFPALDVDMNDAFYARAYHPVNYIHPIGFSILDILQEYGVAVGQLSPEIKEAKKMMATENNNNAQFTQTASVTKPEAENLREAENLSLPKQKDPVVDLEKVKTLPKDKQKKALEAEKARVAKEKEKMEKKAAKEKAKMEKAQANYERRLENMKVVLANYPIADPYLEANYFAFTLGVQAKYALNASKVDPTVKPYLNSFTGSPSFLFEWKKGHLSPTLEFLSTVRGNIGMGLFFLEQSILGGFRGYFLSNFYAGASLGVALGLPLKNNPLGFNDPDGEFADGLEPPASGYLIGQVHAILGGLFKVSDSIFLDLGATVDTYIAFGTPSSILDFRLNQAISSEVAGYFGVRFMFPPKDPKEIMRKKAEKKQKKMKKA